MTHILFREEKRSLKEGQSNNSAPRERRDHALWVQSACLLAHFPGARLDTSFPSFPFHTRNTLS